MRKDVKITAPPDAFPNVAEVRYGLDRVPVPGYFFAMYDAEGRLIRDWDTRPGFALSNSPPVDASFIAGQMMLFSEIDDRDWAAVCLDLPCPAV